MEFSDSLAAVIWINIRVCLPLTFLLMAFCCMVRLDRVPVSYFINLLLSNLVQLIILIALPLLPDYYWKRLISVHIYACCALASLYFRMIIALERCFFISRPLSNCLTQTKYMVILCALVWVCSFGFIPLFFKFAKGLLVLVIAIFPAPVFIVCLFWALKWINTNMSVSAEEKHGDMGTLLLLWVNYMVSIFPVVIYFIYLGDFNRYFFKIADIFLTFFLLSPCMDLILFIFMCKGLIGKLLILCCCKSEANDGSDLNRSSV